MKKPPTGYVHAIKKTKRAPKYMPDEVVVQLDGEPKGNLLLCCGWTMSAGPKDKKWPIDRLKRNLGRIEEEWADEHGKSWRLEIRPA